MGHALLYVAWWAGEEWELEGYGQASFDLTALNWDLKGISRASRSCETSGRGERSLTAST